LTGSEGSRRSTLLRWGGRGFWALTDQGTFAASNFLLNVLLARWLEPHEYGAFAIAFSVFLLLGTYHTALLVEPMLVFGPGKHRTGFERYLGVLLKVHAALTAVMGVVLAIAAAVLWAINGGPLVPALLALAVACPLLLLPWLMRRACYVHLAPRTAALAGIAYLATTLLGATLLAWVDALNAVTAIGVMAFGSLLGATLIGLILRPSTAVNLTDAFARTILADHWRYGRWAAASAALTWVPANIFYIVLPARAGLEAAASLRAIVNLTAPMVQFIGALGTILLPTLVRARVDGRLATVMRTAGTILVTASLVYYAVIAVYHAPITDWLYAGRYLDHAWLVLIIGLRPLTSGLTAVFTNALRALEVPAKVFWAYVVSSLVAVVFAIAAMGPLSLVGAAVGMVLASLATAVVAGWFLTRQRA
jgi:O-antigen/teichoic acid export membrane protein